MPPCRGYHHARFGPRAGETPLVAGVEWLHRCQPGGRLTDEETQAEGQILLHQRGAAVELNARKAKLFAPLRGVLTVWFVALAALLLYREVPARKWTGIERRVHTRMLESTPLGVCLTDDASLIIYTNPAADAILGYKPGELIARCITTVHSFAEEGTLTGQTSSKCAGQAIRAGELPSHTRDSTTVASRVWGARVDVPGKLYWIFVQDRVSAKE